MYFLDCFHSNLPKLKESSLTASSASFLIDCQFYLALNRFWIRAGVQREKDHANVSDAEIRLVRKLKRIWFIHFRNILIYRMTMFLD